MVSKRVLFAAAGALALAALLAGCPAEGESGGGDEGGGFIMAYDGEDGYCVAQWGPWGYGSTEEAFHFRFDKECVLDYTKWDQEAQRRYEYHLIDPLEYDTTKGGYYIAVRKFTDTGEIWER
ncbi:MAG: hypothetical protein MdMp014T_2072 [Treponematales bacterium]